MDGEPESINSDVKKEPPAEPGELYTVEEAARVLERTPGRVRQLLRSGDLEGMHEDGDAGKPWRVYAWSVHTYRDTTRGGPRERRQGTARSARGAPQSGPDMLRVVQDLQRELGRVEGRLEITQRAESGAREERDRLLSERDAERERADDLRRELEAERSKGFFRRLFG